MKIESVLKKVPLIEGVFIKRHQTVHEALQLMAQHNVGALLVVDHENFPLGVISERDYARRVILKGRRSHTTEVWEIMSTDLIFASSDTPLDTCLEIMIEKGVRHLPVFEGVRCIGFLSIADVVSGVLEEREFLLDQLNQYICGRIQAESLVPKIKIVRAS